MKLRKRHKKRPIYINIKSFLVFTAEQGPFYLSTQCNPHEWITLERIN
jgi:hypothetical protein